MTKKNHIQENQRRYWGEAQLSKKLSETSLRGLRKTEEQSGYYLVVREAKH